MEAFTRLFGSLLAFVYHCFDRILIQGYLPLLTLPAPWQYTCTQGISLIAWAPVCDSTRSTYRGSTLFGHNSIHTSARGLPV
jgi:hypothetical protein